MWPLSLALLAVAVLVPAAAFPQTFGVKSLSTQRQFVSSHLQAGPQGERFEQRVDHFDATNTAVWRQRFFVRAKG